MTAPLPTTDAWEPDAERAIQMFIAEARADGFDVTKIQVHRGPDLSDRRVYVTCVSGIREGNGTTGTNHQDHISGDQAP